ncbi:hypothetical protein [Massilia sp. IC2-476]|uniref:hypothetical protein n=1 Tax=Massilia sp. IC2-476 TaxID=2887199 RepID=UPI001D0F5A10|nr:hypothetical protein [Massilia sp. IC2-476]MCC2971633.1 hypothetical protein [Massilia sp. IC2-476]
MLSRSVSRIYFSALLSAGATLGGWAITATFGGDSAALSFLYFSVPTTVGALVIQIVLFSRSEDRLRALIMFNISAGFGVLWLMMCLVLPIFWAGSIGVIGKSILCLFSFVVFYANVAEGVSKFREQWGQKGERILDRHYKAGQGVIDWNKIIGSLKLSASIYIPGIPAKMDPVVSTSLVISMLAGFTLRKVFPIASIFAWSIPSLIVIATILQIVGIAIGQLSVLSELERKNDKVLRLAFPGKTS